MKIPRWLGESYSRIYAEIGAREFQFEKASRVLGFADQRLRITLSALHKVGLLEVLGRIGRKRIYRLADLSEVAVMFGKGVDLSKVPELVRPIVRSYLKEVFDRYGERLISAVLYGSFARGEFKPNSDIDLLLVIAGYKWSESVTSTVADELSFRLWKLMGVYHKVLPYPLNLEQASYHRPLYLDMTTDAIILYDRGGFMGRVLDEIRARLKELGSERHKLPDGSWYWILKPRIKPGEVVEI